MSQALQSMQVSSLVAALVATVKRRGPKESLDLHAHEAKAMGKS